MSADIKKKLQAQLDELESELFIHLPKEIKRAREFGDLRENSEYQTALQRQTMVKARIRELRQRMSEVSSIDLSKIPRDKASYGSTLVLYDAERDEEVTYRLVTPEETDPAAGLISTVSPTTNSRRRIPGSGSRWSRTPGGPTTAPICTAWHFFATSFPQRWQRLLSRAMISSRSTFSTTPTPRMRARRRDSAPSA